MVVIKAETSMEEEDSIMADRGYCGGRSSWNGYSNNNNQYRNGGMNMNECLAICSTKGQTEVNCYYRNNIPADHPLSRVRFVGRKAMQP